MWVLKKLLPFDSNYMISGNGKTIVAVEDQWISVVHGKGWRLNIWNTEGLLDQ